MSGTVAAGGSAVTPVWFLILAAAAALLVAMTFLVVAEALVPSGSLPTRWSCAGSSARNACW